MDGRVGLNLSSFSRAKTYRIPSRKRENLHDIGFGNDFLDMIPKAQTTKEKHINLT